MSRAHLACGPAWRICRGICGRSRPPVLYVVFPGVNVLLQCVDAVGSFSAFWARVLCVRSLMAGLAMVPQASRANVEREARTEQAVFTTLAVPFVVFVVD